MPGARHDWDAIKAEFLEGVPTPTLCAKYRVSPNTIKAHITRKKWVLERMHTGRQKTETIIRSVHHSLAKEAEAYTACVVAHLLPRIKQVFEREFPTQPHELNAHASAVAKLHDIGRKAVGLEDSSIKVQVGLIGSMPEIVEAIEVQAQVSENVSTEPDASPAVEPQSPDSLGNHEL